MIVEIVDGSMQLNGLGAAYEQMRTKIHQFKNEFKHRDQNLYFINVSVGDDGNAKIALMTSFTSVAKDLIDHTWYFDDEWDAQYNCDEYFSGDSVYVWNSLAASKLQRVLNLFENHSNGSATIFVPTRSHTFDYTNTYDPYGTPNYYLNNSRVFAKSFGNFNTSYNLELMEMCYCLDSYLGLGYDYISDHLYVREHPVSWTVNSAITIHNNTKYNYHQLHVQYGQITSITPPSPYDK